MVSRINIESDEILDFYKNSKILNSIDTDRTNQFLVAMSIGFINGKKTPLKGSKSLIIETSINEKALSLMYALAIKDSENIKIVSDKKEVFEIIEQYGNTGIKVLQNLEKNSSYELLDDEFESLIKKHINSLNIN